MDDNKFHISLIIPIYNEEKHLMDLLKSIDLQKIEKGKIEILLINGMSNDNSEEIILDFIKNSKSSHVHYKYLLNKHQKTPYAFNIGILKSKSKIIGFGGAHSIYPKNYFLNALNIFNNLDVDVVGGGLKRYIPDNDNFLSIAISAFYDSPMGGGVASYHRKKQSGFVDTVFGGFYKKTLFDEVGLFNERLHRAQDYEMNQRIRTAGYNIYFNPILNSDYIIKTNYKLFFNRAYNTGKHLPNIWKINLKNLKLRHIVPFFFTIYIFFVINNDFQLNSNQYLLMPLLLYCFLNLISSFWLAFFKGYGMPAVITPILFFIYHIIYGLGTLSGVLILLLNFIIKRIKKIFNNLYNS